MKPEELNCFEQVANVIGEDAARYELQRVIDKVNSKDDPTFVFWNEEGSLQHSFDWNKSDQGQDFWFDIHDGKTPKCYSNKFLDEKSDIERLSQLCVESKMTVCINPDSTFTVIDDDRCKSLDTDSIKTMLTVLKKKKQFLDEMNNWEWG